MFDLGRQPGQKGWASCIPQEKAPEVVPGLRPKKEEMIKLIRLRKDLHPTLHHGFYVLTFLSRSLFREAGSVAGLILQE